MKKLFLFALAVLAAGCEDPAGPDGPGRLVAFSAEAQGGIPPEQPQVNVFATGGRLDVEAVFLTPDVCRRIDAELRNTTGPADEPALVLEVRIERVGEACGGAIGRFGYQATIEAPPGTYFLQVTHRAGSTDRVTVFAHPVVVP